MVAAPIAHADPLDNIRAAVNAARSGSTCGPLNYSGQLEAAAQDLARSGDAIVRINPHGYPGLTSGITNIDDPTSTATAGLVAQDDANIKNCANMDFGVGMFRDSGADKSHVALVLGQPPAPKPAAPPAPAQPVQPAPAAEPAPTQPVTDAISLAFSPPALGNITATISNSSDLNGKCTYDATPFNTHRDFNVPAHGSTPLTFNGLNTGTSYHVTVSCKDASGKQTQPIGTTTQDVSF
jgi:hypothetical protein